MFIYSVESVQSLSCVRLFATPWTAARQAPLSITNSRTLLKLMSIESPMPSNHIFCRPLILLPSMFPSIRIFSSESVLCIRWPKYCSLSFSISPSNECSGLIPFRVDWFDLLAAQGTLKSLLKNYLFIKNYYLFLAVLCLPCDMWAFSRCSKGWGPLFSCGGQPSCCGGFSCCGAQAVGAGSAVVVQKLSCSEACAIFLEGESNLCP